MVGLQPNALRPDSALSSSDDRLRTLDSDCLTTVAAGPGSHGERDGARVAAHEPRGDADDLGLADDGVARALVEADVLRPVGLQVADESLAVHAPAVLGQQRAADALPLQMAV